MGLGPPGVSALPLFWATCVLKKLCGCGGCERFGGFHCCGGMERRVVGGRSRVEGCETLMPCVEGGCGVGMYVSGGGEEP